MERHFLAGLVFRLLRPEDAHSAKVDDRLLSLAFRDETVRVPLRYVRGIRLRHRLGRTALVVDHETGSATVSGLAPAEARALARDIELARQQWWRAAVSGEARTLAGLAGFLDRLDRPPAWVARDAFTRVVEAAAASLDNLAGHCPAEIPSSPELAVADRLRGFLENPEAHRDRGERPLRPQRARCLPHLFRPHRGPPAHRRAAHRRRHR